MGQLGHPPYASWGDIRQARSAALRYLSAPDMCVPPDEHHRNNAHRIRFVTETLRKPPRVLPRFGRVHLDATLDGVESQEGYARGELAVSALLLFMG